MTMFDIRLEYAAGVKYSAPHILEDREYWEDMESWVQARSEYFSPDARMIYKYMNDMFSIPYHLWMPV